MVVINCPRRAEVAAPRVEAPGALTLVYGGTLVPERLPLTIIDALATLDESAELHVIGYETVGAAKYLDRVRAHASALGIGDRVRVLGLIPREEMLRAYARADLGLALVPVSDRSLNFRTMVGASNKPFEFLARGTALLVSDLPEWRRAFVDTGLAIACDPDDAGSIADALRWAASHREELRRMGERGRQRTLGEWNYDAVFAPIRDAILADGPVAVAALRLSEAGR
jgi:glycosyltransferase involved in cell wall biosynthesis